MRISAIAVRTIMLFVIVIDVCECKVVRPAEGEGAVEETSLPEQTMDTGNLTTIPATAVTHTPTRAALANLTKLISDSHTTELNNTYEILNTLQSTNSTNATKKTGSNGFLHVPKKELPMAIIIAGPAAAVSIFLFLCIAFYFHNVQLNRKVKRLSMTLYVTPDHSTDSTKCDSTSSGTYARTHKLSPAAPSPSPVFSRQHSRDSNMSIKSNNSQRRKSTLSPPTLNVPPGVPMGKRGSNWSAVADQEILYLSAPRRHSTFIL